MTILLRLQQSPPYAVFHARGRLSFDQICDSLACFYRETKPKRNANVLWDLRSADVSRLTTTEMEKLPLFARRFTNARKGGRTAIVAEKDIDFAVTRVITFFSHHLPVRVRAFRNLGEAESWLKKDG